MFGGLALIIFGIIFIVFAVLCFCNIKNLTSAQYDVLIWILLIGIIMTIMGGFSIDFSLAHQQSCSKVERHLE